MSFDINDLLSYNRSVKDFNKAPSKKGINDYRHSKLLIPWAKNTNQDHDNGKEKSFAVDVNEFIPKDFLLDS